MAQIEKRANGAYRIRCFCGYSADGKKQKSQSMTWRPPRDNMTPKQLEKALQKAAFEFEERCKGGQTVNAEKFETLAERWFEQYAARTLKPSNLELCRTYSKRVYEYMGHLRIDRITPRTIDDFIYWLSKQDKQTETRVCAAVDIKDIMKKAGLNQNRLARLAEVNPHTVKNACEYVPIRQKSADAIADALDKKPSELFKKWGTPQKLAPKTIKNYVSFVSSIFDYAVHLHLIRENPCRNAALPKIPQREIKMFTIEQAKRFLDILEQPETPVKYRAFFQLAIFGGFRLGEILGLEWGDIDFDNCLIHIRRTVHYSTKRGGYYDTAPKSRASIRDLQLPEYVFFTLKQQRNEQLSQQFKLGDLWHSSARVFTSWDGHQMTGNAPRAWLNKTCESNGLPKVNLHSMRHLNASLLISSGVDVKSVQSILGHSQASTTLDIYAAAFREQQAKALGAVADILTDGRQRKAQ